MSAAVLSLFSCKGNTPTSSPTSSPTTSSLTTSSSQKEFQDEQLGLMKGHFIGQKFELDISAKNSSLLILDSSSSHELRMTDIKKEKYTSVKFENVEFDVDYVYFEDASEEGTQYRIFIPKEDYSDLNLEKNVSGEWKLVDYLYPWVNDYVGTWTTTVNTAGFIRTAVFTDDFIYLSGSNLKLPTGFEYFGASVWWPQFATTFNSETNQYDTTIQVEAYDQNDFSSPFSYYTLGESSDPNYSISIYDASWGMEYYYPSAEYYKGTWVTSNGEISITEGSTTNEFIYNNETYQVEVVKKNDYGWITYLTSGNKKITLKPFVGGFTLESGNSVIEAVSIDTSSLEGTWLYGNKTIKLGIDYDDDWNEVLKVFINGSEVPSSFTCYNRKFVVCFELDGKTAYLSVHHANTIAILNVGEEQSFVCAKEIYEQYFSSVGKLVSSSSLGLLINTLETLEFSDDFKVKFNDKTYPIEYTYDEEMDVVCVKFKEDDKTSYIVRVVDDNVYMLNKESDDQNYTIFATESYLNGFVADWTKRGAKATLTIESNYSVVMDGLRYSTVFDYDNENLEFYMYFIAKDQSAMYTLSLSLGTLKYAKIGYKGEELAVLEDAWYIQVEDYKKIEGTYIYVGERGEEYVIIDDSEAVKITTDVNGQYVLKTYQGDDIRFSYYDDKICLTFKDDNSKMYLYVYTDGIEFNFFNALYYLQAVIAENQGYYEDGTNTLSIGGKAVYYNGSEAKIVSAQGKNLVFTVNGVTYTATFANGKATISDGTNTNTLKKKDFALKDYAGSWTVNNINYSLSVKENTDGSILYTFKMGETSLREYQISVEDGKIVVSFINLLEKYEIRIGEDGKANLTVSSSIPLPPPLPLA